MKECMNENKPIPWNSRFRPDRGTQKHVLSKKKKKKGPRAPSSWRGLWAETTSISGLSALLGCPLRRWYRSQDVFSVLATLWSCPDFSPFQKVEEWGIVASTENQNPQVFISPCALGQFPLRTFIFNTSSLPSDSPLTSLTLVWFHFFLLLILSSFLPKNVPILIILQ